MMSDKPTIECEEFRELMLSYSMAERRHIRDAYQNIIDYIDSLHVRITGSDCISILQNEVAHWKSNHDNQVARAALLTQRPDLPVDRIPAYQEMQRLQNRVAELEDEKSAKQWYPLQGEGNPEYEASIVAATVERCAVICEGADVEDCDGDYYRNDDGAKTLENAAKAIRALSPESIVVERESLLEDLDLINRQGDLLTGVAVALKGNPLPLHRHSHHDLPEVAEKIMCELKELRAVERTIPDGYVLAPKEPTLVMLQQGRYPTDTNANNAYHYYTRMVAAIPQIDSEPKGTV